MLQVASASVIILPVHRIKINTTIHTGSLIHSIRGQCYGRPERKGGVEIACRAILDRLIEVAASVLNAGKADIHLQDERVYVSGQPSPLSWNELIQAAYIKRVSLSEHAHYATPGLHLTVQRKRPSICLPRIWNCHGNNSYGGFVREFMILIP